MLSNTCAHRVRNILATFVVTTTIVGSTSQAGIIVGLLPNPISTAGVPTSTRSGPGTWQLYAIEDSASTDLGIASYNITMSGATAINHRSPNGTATDGNGDTENWGFTLLRSGTNINPIVASQPLMGTTPFVITGLGRTAGMASPQILAADPAATGIVPISGASWGTYSSSSLLLLQNSTGHNWVFLAEGLGSNVSVTSAQFTVLSNAQGGQIAATTTQIQNLQDGAAIVIIDNVNANDPGFVTLDLSSYYTGSPPDLFSPLDAQTPDGVRINPKTFPTIDPVTKVFRWDTRGEVVGRYSWHTSLGYNWTPHVDITVRITAVPEPMTVSLLGAAIATVSVPRRRQLY